MAIFTLYIVMASVHVHNLPSQKAWLVFGIIGLVFALGGFYAEHKARNMASSMEKWQQMGEEYRQSAEDMAASTDEMRKQAQEMAKQFKEQAEEAKRQAEQNQ
jgi:methyl-accepting chemotaxis protein